jgi:indolepyruvate ferredoxin oxidoreductase
MPADGVSIRTPDPVLAQESRMNNYKWYAALAYARANKLNQIIWDSPRARVGIITAGKSYLDTREALADLGIDEQAAKDIGIRLYKIGMTWPLESKVCANLPKVWKKFWWSKKSVRFSNTRSKKSYTTG